MYLYWTRNGSNCVSGKGISESSGAWHVLVCLTDVEIGDTSFSGLESFLIQEEYNPERSGDNGQ
jgi:hypothetical protein